MKYACMFLIVFLMVSLVATSLVQIPVVKAQEQTKTIGNSTVTLYNWTKFWKLFNAHSAWNLEYNNGSGWISRKQDMQILKNYTKTVQNLNGTSFIEYVDKTEASACKITLNFTASYNADYRLTFGIDLAVKNYTHKEGSWNYTISYNNYTVYFDWSDIKELPLDSVTHGIKLIEGKSYFWFRMRKNNVPQGYNLLIDPTFGKTDIGSSYGSDNNWDKACKYTLSESGTITKLSVYLVNDPGNTTLEGSVRVAVYNNTIGSQGSQPHYRLWSNSTYRSFDGETAGWKNWTVDNLELEADEYWFAWTFNDMDCRTVYDAGVTNQSVRDYGWKSPWDDPTVYIDREYSIFATYTTDGVQEYEYELTAIIQPSESLDYDAEKQFIHAEIVTIISYMQFQKEIVTQLFELLETVKIDSIMDYSKEVTLEFFEFFESVHPYALLDYDFEVITPSVDVTTFGTIAFVIAIIALAIGIVAFTKRS